MITIEEIIGYYDITAPKLTSFSIDGAAVVTDVDKFIKTNIRILLEHPGNTAYTPYWERLKSFYLLDRYGKN